MDNEIERHPFDPFIPKDCQLLMLGTFPPKKSKWKMDFYYPNFQNDMWRIFGLIFFDDKEYFMNDTHQLFDAERIKDFLTQKKIGITDTVEAAIREMDNASDKFLKVVEATDLNSILKIYTDCRALVTTGQKASEILAEELNIESIPKVGAKIEFLFRDRQLSFYRMPSTSRAYPKPLLEKANVYKSMFEELGMV